MRAARNRGHYSPLRQSAARSGPASMPFQVRQPSRGPSSVPIASAPYAITGTSLRWRCWASRSAASSRRLPLSVSRRAIAAWVDGGSHGTRDVVAQHPLEERGRIRVGDVGAEVDQVEFRAIGSNGGLRVLDLDRSDGDAELVQGRGHRVGELPAALAATLHRHRETRTPWPVEAFRRCPVACVAKARRFRGQEPVGWCGVLDDSERAPIDRRRRSLAAAPRRVADRPRR